MSGEGPLSSDWQNEGSDSTALSFHFSVKVHRLMCLEIKNFIDRITPKLSAIESARPRSQSGLMVLCALHESMENAKRLIQHCSDASKLYLAISGNSILSRCERIRDKLQSCLRDIQAMVPTLLAVQISKIVDDLTVATFTVESSEDEAGEVVLDLLRQDIAGSNLINMFELKALQVAALRLHITTPLAILIEKRSIKMLKAKINDKHPEKLRILNYFLYLLSKYGSAICGQIKEDANTQHPNLIIERAPHVLNSRDEAQDAIFDAIDPPEEFKCPLSRRLMYNPVTIASGQTFDKTWIEKWFKENETCPTTHVKLHDLSMTPNLTLKGLISKWAAQCGITILDPLSRPNLKRPRVKKNSSSGSIASLNSSLRCLRLQTSNVSFCSSHNTSNSLHQLDTENTDGIDFNLQNISSEHENHGTSFSFLTKLAALPWACQCKAVEDVKDQLRESRDPSLMISTNYIKPLIKFLKNACELRDSEAQKNGADLLLAIFKECRNAIPFLHEETLYTLSLLLDSQATEVVLATFELLSHDDNDFKPELMASYALPSIMQVLDNQANSCYLPALKVLTNLSANSYIGQHMVYLDYISKFAPFWSDGILSGYCIRILKNLCNVEDAVVSIEGSDLYIASIAELLESGSEEDQILAIDVLFSLGQQNEEFYKHVSMESIVSSLFIIAANESSRGRSMAMKLLSLL